MWVSSDKGISKYDGITWTHYGMDEDMPVSMNSGIRVVNNIPVVSGNANNYTFSGKYLKNEEWVDIAIQNKALPKGHKPVWETTENGQSFLFHYVFEDSLHTYFPELGSWSHAHLSTQILGKVSALKSYRSKLLLLGNKGAYWWDDHSYDPLILNYEEFKLLTAPNSSIIDIVFANDSTAFVLGDNWLGEIRSGLFNLLFHEQQKSPKFRELNLHPKGYLFFRSNQKYYWFHLESGQAQTFLTDNEDIHAVLSKMHIDKMGTLWISSYRGLHSISNFLFLTYSQSDGLPKSEVSLIHQLKNKRILVGGVNGYAIFENESIVFAKELKHPKDLNIRFLAADTLAGRTYVVAQNLGLGLLNEKTGLFEWLHSPNIPLLAVKNINDTLWLSDENAMLYYFSLGKLHHKADLNGYVRSIQKGENGEIILCTTDGVTVFDQNQKKLFNQCSNINFRNTYCLLYLNDTAFVGTEGGLARLDGDKAIVKAHYQGHEIASPIYTLLKDAEGALWLGTDNGVLVIRNGKLLNYNEHHGLLGSEVNRSALIQTQEGKVMIGTNRALNIYTQLSLTTLKEVFPLEINWIKINEQYLHHPWRKLDLAADIRSINVGFSAISLNKEEVKFRYRLLGFEKEWQLLQGDNIREVAYKNLPSGEFQLEIQYKLNGTDWSHSTLSDSFSIAAPYYLRWWFIILIGFIMAGLGYFTNQIVNQYKLNHRLRETIKIKVNEVRENETKLKLALENSRLGVWSYDLVTGESEYTQEVYNFLDLPHQSEKLARNNYLLLFHPNDAVKVHLSLKEAITSGQSYDVEFRAKQQNGTYKWLHGKGKCSYNEQGVPLKLTGTLSDISRRKNFEAERERLIAELKRANEELDRFVYSVSHDLSAPIKSIKGLINLTRMASSEEDIKSYIDLIETSVEKQDKFIKEIMDYAYNARKEVSLEEVNLFGLVKDIIDGLAFSELSPKEAIEINIDPSVEITCDRLRLRIILNNLISNSLKFKKNMRYQEHKVIVSAGLLDDGRFVLSVKDNGIGIDPTSLSKIFNMFYRATDMVSGSGLGLYIAKDAAEKMGYHLQVESVLGEGSTFSIVHEL